MKAFEAHTTKEGDKTSTDFSRNLIKERTKANSEPLNAQISTLTQLMKPLIEDDSARIIPTAGSCDHRFQSEFRTRVEIMAETFSVKGR